MVPTASRQSSTRMQLEPIIDNSGDNKISRASSVNSATFNKGSSKTNLNLTSLNSPAAAPNAAGGVAYTGILSHHKRDNSYDRQASGGLANMLAKESFVSCLTFAHK